MFNPLNLEKKVILVTGASSGIGRATTILLSKLGAKLILTARSLERLEETKSLLEGKEHFIQPYDFSNCCDLSDWLKNIAKKIGSISGVVHCAGIRTTQPLRFLDDVSIYKVMQVNLMSSILLSKAFRQKKVYAPNSSIIFISSTAALVGEPGLSVYSASKGAIISLTKSLAVELARDKIRVNCVVPGIVETPMMENEFVKSFNAEQKQALMLQYPFGIGRPEDIANAIAFFLADTSRWITGATLVIDGGYTAK